MFTGGLNLEGIQGIASGEDPVCGMRVEAKSAAGASNYEGQMYYFCSTGCKEKFDAEPAKFAGSAASK